MTNEIALRPVETTPGAAQYFRIIMKKAGPAGRDIRSQTIRLAEKLALRMTFGASSSIRAEAAQGLIESAMYCIGYRLKAMRQGDAVIMLCSSPLESIWREGKDMIKRLAGREREVLGALKCAFNTENRAYNDTLCEGLPAFFKGYDADFAAHESPGMVDYPLSIEAKRLTGIEFVSEYIKRLSIESALCARFETHAQALLRSLGRDWREIHVNIYELVLANAAARALCGKDLNTLDVGEADREKLLFSLRGMPKHRLLFMLCAAAERVCSLAGIADSESRMYARASMRAIAARVKNAVETDSLRAVFLSCGKEEPVLCFSSGANMDGEAFRATVEELRECSRVSDKLAIIKRSVMSMDDIADILGASCLKGKEFDAVFDTLGDDALALLWLRIPEQDALHVSEAEREWHGALKAYAESRGKTGRIRNTAKMIEQR